MADETYTLAFKQGATLQRTFSWTINLEPQSFENKVLKAQVRKKESASSEILIDLVPYMTKSGDYLSVILRVPGHVTAAISDRSWKTAAWDFFLLNANDLDDSILLVQGPATLDPATTDMRAETP